MRQIKLVMDKPFPAYVDFSIIDVTEGKEKRRGGLTADYSRVDLKPMIDAGMDEEEIVNEYDKWLEKTLRRYLLDDCQVVQGRAEFLSIIKENIKKYFN